MELVTQINIDTKNNRPLHGTWWYTKTNIII